MNRKKIDAICNGIAWAAGSLIAVVGVWCAVYLADIVFDWRIWS